MIRIYKYSAQSRSYIMIDGRDVEIPRFRNARTVSDLCVVNGVDGVVIIDRSEPADFCLTLRDRSGSEIVPGADGSGAADCRDSGAAAYHDSGAAACAVAFADLLGVKAFHTQNYTFEWGGIVFEAYIASHLGEVKEVSLNGADAVSALCEGLMD